MLLESEYTERNNTVSQKTASITSRYLSWILDTSVSCDWHAGSAYTANHNHSDQFWWIYQTEQGRLWFIHPWMIDYFKIELFRLLGGNLYILSYCRKPKYRNDSFLPLLVHRENNMTNCILIYIYLSFIYELGRH